LDLSVTGVIFCGLQLMPADTNKDDLSKAPKIDYDKAEEVIDRR